jgi:hypothetical protein
VRWREDGLISQDDFEPKLSHRDKQRLLFAFFFAKSLLIGAKAYYQDDRRHPDLTGMNLDELNREEAVTKIWRAYMNPNDKAFLEFVTQFAIANGGRHMQHVELLAVDYVKQLGFYEDVGETGEILSPFGRPKVEDAHDMIELAESAIKVPTMSAWWQGVVCAVFKVGPHMTEAQARRTMNSAVRRHT